MRFENLSAFYYLWLLPIIILISWVFTKSHSKKISKGISKKLMPYLTSSVSLGKRKWKFTLQIFVLVFFVFALARPQMGQSLTEVKSEGVEIVIAADVSESMLADDVKPSRLEQVKQEMSRLVELMPGNKVGVIAFAGNAVLLSPLSNDPSALKMYIDSLATDSVTEQGTNFKSMLELAKEAFERGGVGGDPTSRVTRVILVVSDGEDNEQGALDQAQELVKQGIRIFSIAYGTEKGAPIPVRDQFGYLRGYKKDRSGQTVMTTVKGEALKNLANSGKGAFYFASFGGNHLSKLVEDLGKLEKAQFDTTMATQYDEQYQYYLLFGILLALIELALGERRKEFKFWKGRFEVPPA